MTEQVIRHRGYTRDTKGKYTGGTDVPLQAIEVAPGASNRQGRVIQQARDGETIAATVYFEPGTDVQDGDDLTVRNMRYRTIVNGWLPDDGLGGFEVLCTRGQG